MIFLQLVKNIYPQVSVNGLTFQSKDSLENKFNIKINNLQYNQIVSSVAQFSWIQ